MIHVQSLRWSLVWAVFLCIIVLADCSPPKTSFTVTKATVLKVYSATDPTGHRFISYVVDRGGDEIVVSDTLAKSTYKVGDTIEYLDQKIEVSGVKTLNFTISD